VAVSNELVRPDTEDDFEAMCHQLYSHIWRDSTCVRVGRGGQAQFGVDILGNDGNRPVGVQCKHFNKKKFTLGVVTGDVDEADKAGLKIDLLIFATTAPSDSSVVRYVVELSETRRKQGKFAVSVHFWSDICGHIRMQPEVGRAFIPNFPGGTVLSIKEDTATTLSVIRETQVSSETFHTETTEQLKELVRLVQARQPATTAPDANGTEADPGVVASLDFVRDRLNEGKSQDARMLLEQLGDPDRFRDVFSRFRWHSNRAAVDLIEGDYEQAAERYLRAFELAPENEKANANRVHAHFLLGEFGAAQSACDEGLSKYPGSSLLWALRLHVLSELGQLDPEAELPEALRNSDDMLFARARLCSRRGDLLGSLDFLRRSMAAGPDSIELQRFFLADALSWASIEPVAALHGQIGKAQRAALCDAVARFEPIENKLASIQADHVSLELTNNLALALQLLGDKDRARAVAKQALPRHPLSEGLLRIRLQHLDELGDVAAIRTLTDARLAELPPSALALLAEIFANRGDVTLYSSVMSVVEAKFQEPDKLRQLRVLAFHAQWCAGQRPEAVDATRAYVQKYPAHVLGRVMMGHMLRRSGDRAGAIAQAKACLDHLPSTGASLEILQVAELFYALRQFGDAARLLGHLVIAPGRDEVTYKLLFSLVSADQRQRAQLLLDRLAPDVRQALEVRRVEIDLARRKGDWSHMGDLLAIDVAGEPTNASFAVDYAGALLRAGKADQFKAFVDGDPRFANAEIDDEIEFAKYQVHAGLSERATMRMIELFRQYPSDAKVAGYLLIQMLMSTNRSLVEPPDVVGPGVAVHLQGAIESWWVVIDNAVRTGQSWPEIVTPSGEVARGLRGKRLGEVAQVRRGLGEQEARVIELGTLMGFAAHKAQELIASSASPHGPIWSVRIIDDAGHADIETLLRVGKERRERVEVALGLYKQHPIPLCTLAHVLGVEIDALLLDWPYNEASLFVGFGSHEELDASLGVVRTPGLRYVVDLLTIIEMVRHKAVESFIRLLGRPLVPQTVRESLVRSLHLADSSVAKSSAVVSETDGRLVYTPVPPSYHQIRAKLLRRVLEKIDGQCELTPVMGPQVVSEEHRILGDVLDRATHDVVYLCLERDAVLLSEDGALRLLTASVGVRASVGLQAVLMEACDRGSYSRDAYADTIARKLAAGHDFVSIRAQDLTSLAERNPHKVSLAVMAALETFRRPTLDIQSGAMVGSAFLHDAAERLPPKIVGTYARRVHEVLIHGRPGLAPEITRGLARMLQAQPLYGRGGRRIAKAHRRLFGDLLLRASRERATSKRREGIDTLEGEGEGAEARNGPVLAQ
jgi:tetratricopeptide (TPR) repeat protein